MEAAMKHKWLTVPALAIVLSIGGQAFARDKHKEQTRCVPNKPYEFSWSFLLPGQPAPQPNGCAPPVYAYGKYIGQDPDPNIRFQMHRDPATGYYAYP
jgi:hypothetical protein